MDYTLFGSKQQINKAAKGLIKTGPDLKELSYKVKYVGGVQDNTLNFESYISLKVKKARTNFIFQNKINTQVHYQRSLHHIGTNVLHFTPGLQQCSTLWAAEQSHQKISNNTKHLCQSCTG